MHGSTHDGAAIAGDLLAQAMSKDVDEAQVEHIKSNTFEVSFDTGEVTLVRSAANEGAYLSVVKEQKKGSVNFTGLGTESVGQALQGALDALESGLPDPANELADAPSLAPTNHGSEEPDKEAMLDSVADHLAYMQSRHPLILERSSSYVFTHRRRSFVNSRGVEQQEAGPG